MAAQGVTAKPATDEAEVLYSVSDHVATITLNRPERMNTISGPMLAQLTQRLLGGRRRPRRCGSSC